VVGCRHFSLVLLADGSFHVRRATCVRGNSCSHLSPRETRQNHSLEKMTAVWLLPVVTLIVASSSGGVLSHALEDVSPSRALFTVTFSAFLVTVGLSLATMMLTIYFLRLIIYGLPPTATMISVFLPLGPTGQAGFSILLIGQSYKALLPVHSTGSNPGETVHIVCICVAFVLWSLATMWLLYALLAMLDVLRSARVPFKVPFWGLIFPNVCRNLTSIYYRLFPHAQLF
jgi:tellurite resistance protein TehA-like permease